jgi:hypothetical protein|tara:strand:- start:579 stop:719 length:141 start_codon:yes stop_codon:yes gene_type:complete
MKNTKYSSIMKKSKGGSMMKKSKGPGMKSGGSVVAGNANRRRADQS